MTTIEKTAYRGWANCYRLANRSVELIVTTDVGPRVIFFGFSGEENEFYEKPEDLGQTGGDQWRLFGGHRLWHAPEKPERTYYPDNHPVRIETDAACVRLTAEAEANTGIEKTIEIELDAEAPVVTVTHRLKNSGVWPVPLAPWALSVMRAGGVAVIPHPPRAPWPEILTPLHSLALWSYTDMADPRWTWGEQYILLRQDPQNARPQKLGVHNTQGWIAYLRNGKAFVKRFDYQPDAAYPDLSSTVEVWTNHEMLEIETLGPYGPLEPGGTVAHRERWQLLRDIPAPTGDAAVEQYLVPAIQASIG
ncbi:MAG TPA: DUF4380 domain-containing protein [Anaerolineaceae bacterium]|nr:DUF4380 domain-containing protein [Anaerolineaceae bacterium]